MNNLRSLVLGILKSFLAAIGVYLDYGTVTGTTITFAHKFVSAPIILLTPLAATGSPIATVVSKNVDGSGYYITATIVMTGATSVDWIAIGTGVSA